jgi:mono/diheme cytochrome c family protein
MTRPRFLVRIAAGVSLPVVLLLLPQPSGAAEPPAKGAEPFAGAAAFLKKHCLACHDADDPSGNLDLGALPFDAGDRDNFARWVRIHDRVQAGEMPPPEESQPDARSAAAFVEGLSKTLIQSEQATYARNGRATLRRLNRYEYENAVRDLLNVPWAEIKEKLPDDGEAHRFNKIGLCVSGPLR